MSQAGYESMDDLVYRDTRQGSPDVSPFFRIEQSLARCGQSERGQDAPVENEDDARFAVRKIDPHSRGLESPSRSGWHRGADDDVDLGTRSSGWTSEFRPVGTDSGVAQKRCDLVTNCVRLEKKAVGIA